jgi:hypothetical protein
VQRLHKDLRPAALARRDWEANVFARQTLGDNTEVELWYLAQHFLLAWHDWHALRERFPRYFGEAEQAFPAAWRRLDADCGALANHLLREMALDELVANDWFSTGAVGAKQQNNTVPVRDAYHTVVQNYRRWSLLQDAEAGRLEPEASVADVEPPRGEIWPQCRKLIVWLNDENAHFARENLIDKPGCDLRWHLRHYCHANLLVSWLVNGAEGDGRGDGYGYGDGRGGGRGDGWQPGPRMVRGRPALIQLLSEKIVVPGIEQYLSGLTDAELRGIASQVLERITAAIGEIGYDQFVEDVTSDDFRGGQESLVGAGAINLIPSRTRGPCHKLLLAVSKGDKKWLGFPNVMRQVREHLIRCPVTQAVIVLCDRWSPTILDEHIGDLRAHHDKGVRFLFLMAGLPGRVVSPVAVDLSLSP